MIRSSSFTYYSCQIVSRTCQNAFIFHLFKQIFKFFLFIFNIQRFFYSTNIYDIGIFGLVIVIVIRPIVYASTWSLAVYHPMASNFLCVGTPSKVSTRSFFIIWIRIWSKRILWFINAFIFKFIKNTWKSSLWCFIKILLRKWYFWLYFWKDINTASVLLLNCYRNAW